MDLNVLINAAAENWFWTIIGTVFVVSTIFGSVKSMVRSAHRERTRREIAAYIAEGSMTPEQGERLMKAKSNGDDAC